MIIKRSPYSSAFTLTETLATMGVLAVFGMLLTGLLGGSMGAVHHTERTLRNGAAVREFGTVAGEDLAAFQPSDLPGRRSQLIIEQTDERVRIAIVRPATRVRNLELAGYTSQVIYEWDRKRQDITRTEYNSANDRAAADRTGVSSKGSDHNANLARAAALSPAWEAENEADWMADDRIARLTKRAQAVPLLTHVRSFEVTSFRDYSLGETTSSAATGEAETTPAVIRFRMEFAGDGTSAVHPVELLLPVGANSE